MKNRFFMNTLIVLVLMSCKSGVHTINDLPDNQLIFGSGGGITGEVNTYTLLENGQLFYHSSLIEGHKELKRIPEKSAKAHFEKLKDLQLSEIQFDHPGNMYYFIEEVNGTKKHRVTWGSLEHEMKEEYRDFYKELRTSVK